MTADILAIAAHRDDVELTCAGTLIRAADAGHSTAILDLTAGESGTRGSAAQRAEEAEREYRRCLELQPDWLAVAISLGRCLVMRGAFDEARGVLEAARGMALRQGHSSPLQEIADLESRCV